MTLSPAFSSPTIPVPLWSRFPVPYGACKTSGSPESLSCNRTYICGYHLEVWSLILQSTFLGIHRAKLVPQTPTCWGPWQPLGNCMNWWKKTWDSSRLVSHEDFAVYDNLKPRSVPPIPMYRQLESRVFAHKMTARNFATYLKHSMEGLVSPH